MMEKADPENTNTRSRWEKRPFLVRFFAFFGIVISPDKKHPVHLSWLFFIWIGIGVICCFVAMAGVYSYSTNPNFCNSCHIMGPYYNAWKTSKHFGKADCVDCHYPPATNLKEHLWHKFQASAQVVKYVTRTYSSRPFAEIPDASCLRSGCHSTRLLEGRVATANGIKFDHRPHLTETRRERKLRCVSCHSQIVIGTHVEVTYSTCFLCHFRQPKEGGASTKPPPECLNCHNLPEENFQLGTMTYNHKDFVTKQGVACSNCHLDITSGEGKAKEERCLTCHNQPEKLARFGDMTFIHENHVTKHHVACLHCHDELRHGFQEAKADTMLRLGEPPLPETSHPKPPPTLAFNCAYCHENKHTGQLEMYSGKAPGLGLPDMPSPMFLANVDCVGCHYRETTATEEQEFKGHTIAASPQACVKCHSPEFEGILKQTRTVLDETLSKLKEKRSALEQGMVTLKKGEAEKRSIAKQTDEAERLERFVRLSRGDHNIYLASVVLRREDALLTEAATKVAVPVADLSALPLLSGGYCATTCHEQLKVKVPPETVNVSGKTMPHLMHTTLMGCVSCHEIGGHKQVPLKGDVRRTVCSGCH